MPARAVSLQLTVALAVCAGTTSATSVAVVGGGIAGGATVLELVRRRKEGAPVDVTLFEHAASIGHAKSASGIIAASLIFERHGQHGWHKVEELDDVIELLQRVRYSIDPRVRVSRFAANFLKRYLLDPRTKPEYQRRFLGQSRVRLEEQLDTFPELCDAIVGPFCCRVGSKARDWMRAHQRSCETARGWTHAFLDEDNFRKVDVEEIKQLGWKVITNSTGAMIDGHAVPTLSELQGFVDERIVGAVWNGVDQGFVRVEDLFPRLAGIFQREGVTTALNCTVASLRPHPGGRVEVLAAEGCAHAGVFDKVIVAAGANSVNVLPPIDEMIREELVPLKGFACMSEAPLAEGPLLGVGVQPEELHHYIRSRRGGGVNYGYGLQCSTFDDELLAPRYEEDAEDWPGGIRRTELGRRLLEQPDVQRLAGIRPFGCFGNLPLLKTYPGEWSGVVLHSGGGFNGFTLSWKGAEVAVDAALGVAGGEWGDAVRLYQGCDVGFFHCLRWYYYPLFFLACACGWCCLWACGFDLLRRRSRRKGSSYVQIKGP